MKKLVLLLGTLVLLCGTAQAGIISYDSIVSASDVKISWLNGMKDTIFGEFDGNIEGVNIKDGTLVAADFATSSSPITRTDEQIGDYTYTGHLPVTDATLTSDISAGTSYVNGYRCATAATSKTYTASKDTWVYIDQNSAFQYVETAVGAAQPTTPANSLLLAKVTTSGAAITVVTDLRTTTPPALRIYQDYKQGLVISRDITGADKVTIGRGEIDFGASVSSGLRRNTSAVEIDFATTGRGGLDTGTQSAKTIYYIFVVADDANSTNYEGIASISSTDASTVTGERLVGHAWSDESTNISPDSVGAYRGVGGDAPNTAQRSQAGVAINVTDTTYPSADFDASKTKFNSSGRPVLITGKARHTSSGATVTMSMVITIDGDDKEETETTGSSVGTGTPESVACMWQGTLATGLHEIKLSAITEGNTNIIDDWTLTITEL